jgi:hypothetical protein
MEENTVTGMEAEQTSDAFMAGWEDTDTYFVETDQSTEQVEESVTEPEAEEGEVAEKQGTPEEHTSSETQETPAENAAESAPKVDAPKSWTLQHMDEVKTVGETEMVTLAQKGMDYDRIRSKWDEAKPVMELFNQFAQKAGMNVSDYIAYIRTQAKQSQGMSEEEAKRSVDLEDREAAVAAKEAKHAAEDTAQAKRNEAEARRQADIEEFRKTYPDAAKDPKSIPQEVWEQVNKGSSLVVAYAMYDAKRARAAQAAAEQKLNATAKNQSNAARSTGSMHSSGDSMKSKDPFLEGWGD